MVELVYSHTVPLFSGIAAFNPQNWKNFEAPVKEAFPAAPPQIKAKELRSEQLPLTPQSTHLWKGCILKSCIKSPCFIANSSSWSTIILGGKEKVLAWSAQRVIEDWQSDQGGINPSSSQLQWGAILGWWGRSLFRKLGDRNVPLIKIASCQKARFITLLSGSEVSWVRFS